MSTVKVRALIGKEWGPISWDGDMWEDLDGARDIEPLNSDKSFPVEEVFPHPKWNRPSRPFHLSLKGFTLHRRRRTLRPFPEAVSTQDNAEYPQDPPHHPSLLLHL